MIDAIKNCLQCGTPMQAQKSTKKYCSDTCKQAAFYRRNTKPLLTLNGSETLNGNDSEDIPEEPVGKVNPDSEAVNKEQQPEKIPFDVSPDVRNYDERQQPLPFNVRKSGNQTIPGEQGNVKQKDSSPVKESRKQNKTKQADEDPYEYVQSGFLNEIAEYLEDNYKTTEMFQSPKKYWYGSDLESVKWVSVRFRCIIENLLRFDNSTVERKTLVTVNKALTDMMAASNFKYMPYNYPLTDEIKEQQQRLDKIIKAFGGTFRFGLKRNSKIKLIALRFQLADLVTKVKFHDLNFSK